jgi:hypothetical protein
MTKRRRIITLLAPNPSAGKRVLQSIAKLTTYGELSRGKDESILPVLSAKGEDTTLVPLADGASTTMSSVLLRRFRRFVLPQPQWHSLSLQQGRTIIQCLSLNHQWLEMDASTKGGGPPFRVIGIQETNDPHTDDDDNNNNGDNYASATAAAFRAALLAHVYQSVSPANLATSMFFSRQLGPAALPLWLDVVPTRSSEIIPTSTTTTSSSSHDDNYFEDGDLKEVVLYESLLMPHLLPSPVTGVYVTPTGLRIRPLPPAVLDRRPTSSTLIFHRSTSSSSNESSYDDHDDNRFFRRIGYTGRHGHGGQLLFQHADNLGLRLCRVQQQPPRSMFAEAQDSLLASSLADLQSNRVLIKTTTKMDSNRDNNMLSAAGNDDDDDPRRNRSDCWVEVRAQLTTPSSFWQKKQSWPAASSKNPQ